MDGKMGQERQELCNNANGQLDIAYGVSYFYLLTEPPNPGRDDATIRYASII